MAIKVFYFPNSYYSCIESMRSKANLDQSFKRVKIFQVLYRTLSVSFLPRWPPSILVLRAAGVRRSGLMHPEG